MHTYVNNSCPWLQICVRKHAGFPLSHGLRFEMACPRLFCGGGMQEIGLPSRALAIIHAPHKVLRWAREGGAMDRQDSVYKSSSIHPPLQRSIHSLFFLEEQGRNKTKNMDAMFFFSIHAHLHFGINKITWSERCRLDRCEIVESQVPVVCTSKSLSNI